MNQQTYNLVIKILDSDLSQRDKGEIVRFYCIPRNINVPAAIEISDEEDDELGPVKQPTAEDLKRKANPELAAEKDAIRETLKGVIDAK